MNHKGKQVILLFALILLLVGDSSVRGQRRGGAVGAAGARGGAAGGARAGVAVGPYGGGGAAVQRGAGVVGPGGASAARGSTRGSYTTGGGSTINYAGAGGRATGPAGGTAARGAGAVQVTTPGGQTYTKAGRAAGAIGPAGNAVGGKSSVGVATGPGGTAVGASRGGFATGPGGTVAGGSRVGAAAGPGGAVAGGSRVGVATGPGGTVAGGSRAGVAVGPGGAVAGGTRWGAAAGPYGYAGYGYRGAAVGHRTQFWGATQLPVWGTTVRGNFVHWNSFNRAWYGAHPAAWRAARWTAATVWAGTTWAALASACGYPAQPIVYDYGSTIVYQGDQVYINGDPVATADQYADQAAQIASEGAEANAPADQEWMPLGVFGMIQGEEKDANKIFQLAIDRNGIIRGNYYDALSDTTIPVHGAVEKKTQRAAWYIGDRKDTVYETGIASLMEPECAMLVHFGKERTQQWLLVRLEKNEEEK